MTRVRVAILAAIGVALACSVITLPAVPFAPSNTCGTSADCNSTFPDSGANVSCTGGACVSLGAFRPILVVAVPTTALNGGGTTFALPDNYVLELPPAPAGCGNIPETQTCFFLPPLASLVSGFLNISSGLGIALWPPGGLRPNIPDGNPTTLPTRAIFHPLWIDPVSGHTTLATKLGLPLPDIIATQANSANGVPELLAPTNGTQALPGFIFSANVPQPIAPNNPSGFYALEIVPSDPYAVFPPFVRPLDPRPVVDGGAPSGDPMFLDGFPVAPTTPTLTPLALSLVNVSPTYDPITSVQQLVMITEGPGAVSLEGWSVSLIDVDGRRVSGRVILPAGTTKQITLYEAFNMTTTSQTLVIAPPPTIDWPQLQVPGNALAGAHTYDALSTQPQVSGSVQPTNQLGTTTSAQITFFANGLSSDATLVHADNSPATELDYDKIVATDASGNYSTTLPPGSLRAYVVPSDPNLAITLNDFQVIAGSAQTGKALLVQPRTHVKGRVVLADGTPLYSALVVISPSADLPLAQNGDDPLLRPREVQGSTDVNGMFDIPSDPGQVDISIRPADGTQFPWVVLTSRTVPPNGGNDAGADVALTLATITIPLPTPFPPGNIAVLTDSLGNPVAHAIVRAYAFPPPATTMDGGTPQSRGARLLGATTSDANGNFQLFVAPPDPE